MKSTRIFFCELIVPCILLLFICACKKNKTEVVEKKETIYVCNPDTAIVCSNDSISPCSEDTSKANVRIKNISKYNFCNLVLLSNDDLEQFTYGKIMSGDSTCYYPYNKIYGYVVLNFYVCDKHFSWIPEDWVGEPTLGKGKYTILLDLPDYDIDQVYYTIQKD